MPSPATVPVPSVARRARSSAPAVETGHDDSRQGRALHRRATPAPAAAPALPPASPRDRRAARSRRTIASGADGNAMSGTRRPTATPTTGRDPPACPAAARQRRRIRHQPRSLAAMFSTSTHRQVPDEASIAPATSRAVGPPPHPRADGQDDGQVHRRRRGRADSGSIERSRRGHRFDQIPGGQPRGVPFPSARSTRTGPDPGCSAPST